MKVIKTSLLLSLIVLSSCKKETAERVAANTNSAKIISYSTFYGTNQSWNRTVNFSYSIDTFVYKKISVTKPNSEVHLSDAKNISGNITFTDHKSCLCETYYTINFLDKQGNKTNIVTELTKP